jgi:hypothetical protein
MRAWWRYHTRALTSALRQPGFEAIIGLVWLSIVLTAVLSAQTVGTGIFSRIRWNSNSGPFDSASTGTPESAVTAPVGSLFRRTDGSGGTVLYVKESGSGNTGWIAPATAASTSTLTNKTLDVEGTGNVVTVPVRLWWPAATCQNATAITDWSTPTANPAVAACVTGSNTQKGVLDFADGANTLSVQRLLRLPADWIGTIDAALVWFTPATTGSVVWQVATICVADAETGDPAFNAASTVTDAAKASTNQFNDAAITTVTITGCAAGETLHLRVFRDPTHGSDTLADTARLVGVELTYRRAL